jgi:hypothetical protein
LSVILADIAARRPVRQLDAEPQAARDHHNLPGRRFDHAQLGDKAGAALLRHDQHFAVGIVEAAIGHRAVGGVDVDCHADLGRHVAVAAERDDAGDEVGGLFRNRYRAPTQLRRRGVDIVKRRAADHAVVDARIGPMHDGGLDAIGPGAAILAARRRERGAGDQFGIEPVRRVLRRIPSDRQRAGHRFRDKVVAEAGLVGQLGGRAFGRSSADLGFLIHREPLERPLAVTARQAQQSARRPPSRYRPR